MLAFAAVSELKYEVAVDYDLPEDEKDAEEQMVYREHAYPVDTMATRRAAGTSRHGEQKRPLKKSFE